MPWNTVRITHNDAKLMAFNINWLRLIVLLHYYTKPDYSASDANLHDRVQINAAALGRLRLWAVWSEFTDSSQNWLFQRLFRTWDPTAQHCVGLQRSPQFIGYAHSPASQSQLGRRQWDESRTRDCQWLRREPTARIRRRILHAAHYGKAYMQSQ